MWWRSVVKVTQMHRELLNEVKEKGFKSGLCSKSFKIIHMEVKIPQKRGFFCTWFIMLHELPALHSGPFSVWGISCVKTWWAGQTQKSLSTLWTLCELCEKWFFWKVTVHCLETHCSLIDQFIMFSVSPACSHTSSSCSKKGMEGSSMARSVPAVLSSELRVFRPPCVHWADITRIKGGKKRRSLIMTRQWEVCSLLESLFQK